VWISFNSCRIIYVFYNLGRI